ncbi:MAG: cation-transporting P-type ATPase [Acidovorax sp.]|nr:cation-transporting P-type ATPase [Acidovorax sp.]
MTGNSREKKRDGNGESTQPAAIAAMSWHVGPASEVLQVLGSSQQGIGQVEVARRLEIYGPNRLPEAVQASPLARLVRQFNNLLLIVLMLASVVTAAMGHWIDSGVIAAAVLINAVVGFVQEGKAERSLQAIRRLLSPRAVVLRDGRQHDVDAADLVPGDVVQLASGDSLPADVRLLQARNLHIDESVLTGESVPAAKHSDPVADDAAIGDRRCMGYAGTLITQGQARAVVVATGAATEMGRIGRMLASVEQGTTPLLAKMNVFGRRLTVVILATAALLFLFGTLLRGMSASEMFLAAVGLAVAAIPEGLPTILTVTLAIGVQRMARRHAVIRRLPAVETLGSVTVICSDKTGTLTRNEMTVQSVVCAGLPLEVEGAGYAPVGTLTLDGQALEAAHLAQTAPVVLRLAQAAALCNDASLHEDDKGWQLAGDPTEGALLTLAMKVGVNPVALKIERARLDVIPFESEHRYMATLHRSSNGNGNLLLVKGAPERVLAMCAQQAGRDGRAEPMDTTSWRAAIDAQARAGRRVLALAERELPTGPDLQQSDAEHGLTLLGIVGIIDPPRAEAMQAVAQCRNAGIRVVMITGDHGVTASAIAMQLGMGDDHQAITGPELEAMDDAALRESVRHARVFARASPEHKLRLVRALQANGEIVAMTGDGVNDAPALKQADVGIAMGRKGTEAAKQAGAVVLADDNFASIAHAVEEGRTVYDNLKKTVTFMLPVNGGESLSLLLAVLLGVALPILPAQVLWVNMVGSVALAMVLAFEPPEPGVMQRPPRPPGEPLLSRFLVWRIVLVSTLFLAGIFGMFEWALWHGASVEAARTVAVNTLVCMEVFYLFSVRYLKARSFTWQGVRGTPRVLAAVGGVFAMQLLFTYAPVMQQLLRTEALPLTWGLRIVAVGFALLIVLEFEKALLRHFGGSPQGASPAENP